MLHPVDALADLRGGGFSVLIMLGFMLSVYQIACVFIFRERHTVSSYPAPQHAPEL